MNPVAFFAESSTFGTILVIVVYALSNLALPFYYKRFHPELFNSFRHVVLPAIGFILIAVLSITWLDRIRRHRHTTGTRGSPVDSSSWRSSTRVCS